MFNFGYFNVDAQGTRFFDHNHVWNLQVGGGGGGGGGGGALWSAISYAMGPKYFESRIQSQSPVSRPCVFVFTFVFICVLYTAKV